MKKWTVLTALVWAVGAAMPVAAAAPVMLAPDVTIRVDIPKFGLVLPSANTWNFTLTSGDQDPTDGLTFTATEPAGTYYLRVWSNTDVTVSLDDGVITVGTHSFHPVYAWTAGAGATGTLTSSFTAGSPASLYVSGGAHNGATLNLSSFSVTVTDITQFTPGSAAGRPASRWHPHGAGAGWSPLCTWRAEAMRNRLTHDER